MTSNVVTSYVARPLVAVLTAPDNVDNVFGLGIFRLDAATEVIFADAFEG